MEKAEVDRELMRQLQRGQVSPAEYQTEYLHLVWQRVANLLGMDYRREWTIDGVRNNPMSLQLDGNYDLMGSLCILCRHRAAGEHQVCAAFPQGIPPAILRDEHDHHFPYPGDHGIRYELCTEEAAVRPERQGIETAA